MIAIRASMISYCYNVQNVDCRINVKSWANIFVVTECLKMCPDLRGLWGLHTKEYKFLIRMII